MIQIAVLFLLLIGYKFVREGKLRRHGLTMSAAVILHVAFILLVMVPSFVTFFGALADVTSPGVIITWIHVLTGIYATVVGIYLVSAWRFQSESTCMRRKNRMKPLLVLWTIALILGIAFYAYYYL